MAAGAGGAGRPAPFFGACLAACALLEGSGLLFACCFVAEDGDIVEVTPESIKVTDHVTCGNVFVDGLGVGDIGHIVLRDRQVLAQDGILMAVLTVDKETGQPLAGPDIVSRGFVYMRDSEELLESARERVLESFIGLNGHASDWSFVKDKIRHTLSEFLYEKTHRRPMILPIVMEV